MDEATHRDGAAAVTPQQQPEYTIDDSSQIREQIEHTREDVAMTAAALADKADVKARAKRRIGEVREQVEHAGEGIKQQFGQSAPDSAGDAADRAADVPGQAVNGMRSRIRQNPLPMAAGIALLAFLVGRLSKR